MRLCQQPQGSLYGPELFNPSHPPGIVGCGNRPGTIPFVIDSPTHIWVIIRHLRSFPDKEPILAHYIGVGGHSRSVRIGLIDRVGRDPQTRTQLHKWPAGKAQPIHRAIRQLAEDAAADFASVRYEVHIVK